MKREVQHKYRYMNTDTNDKPEASGLACLVPLHCASRRTICGRYAAHAITNLMRIGGFMRVARALLRVLLRCRVPETANPPAPAHVSRMWRPGAPHGGNRARTDSDIPAQIFAAKQPEVPLSSTSRVTRRELEG